MRSCNGCTKCCEGWLWGQAHEHRFFPGRKCHYMSSSGCSIYSTRPDNPCRSYKCVWLGDDSFPIPADTIPEWMYPKDSNVIMTWRTYEDHDLAHLEIMEAGAPMKASVLSWVIQYCLNQKLNVKYQVDGGWNKIGCDEFLCSDL